MTETRWIILEHTGSYVSVSGDEDSPYFNNHVWIKLEETVNNARCNILLPDTMARELVNKLSEYLNKRKG